jgi:bacillithiol biosynthesis cysteine-adding enzyme BshC
MPPVDTAHPDLLMASDLIIQTESLGGSPLAQLALRGEAPGDWYDERPRSAEAWRARATSVRGAHADDWWDAIAPACVPSGAAAARITRVAAENGVVITTGQQPGLFGGPLYTWYKALSALALADAMEEATGIPVAPVFWAGTDDSDFAEASWTAVSVPGGAERLELPHSAAEGARMAEVPLGNVGLLLAALERACGSAADPWPLHAVRRAYDGRATVGSAYVTLLRELLEPLGIVVLEATHPTVSRAADPLLRRALVEHEAIMRALRERGEAITAAGFELQATQVEGLTLVMALVHGRRERVRTDQASRVASSTGPGQLGANVLLRPVVERALLPTVGYLAGPGEFAYFAQVTAVADALGVARPLPLPRWSGTVIEPHVAELLRRHGLSTRDFTDPHAVEGRLARAAWPPAVSSAFTALRDSIQAHTDALREAISDDTARVPLTAVEGLHRGLEWRLGRFERRLTAAVKRREGQLMHEVGTIRGALRPFGLRQERALNLIPLLARHGVTLLERLRDEAARHARGLVARPVVGVNTP